MRFLKLTGTKDNQVYYIDVHEIDYMEIMTNSEVEKIQKIDLYAVNPLYSSNTKKNEDSYTLVHMKSGVSLLVLESPSMILA